MANGATVRARDMLIAIVRTNTANLREEKRARHSLEWRYSPRQFPDNYKAAGTPRGNKKGPRNNPGGHSESPSAADYFFSGSFFLSVVSFFSVSLLPTSVISICISIF